jgi:hypothetical protein
MGSSKNWTENDRNLDGKRNPLSRKGGSAHSSPLKVGDAVTFSCTESLKIKKGKLFMKICLGLSVSELTK